MEVWKIVLGVISIVLNIGVLVWVVYNILDLQDKARVTTRTLIALLEKKDKKTSSRKAQPRTKDGKFAKKGKK